MTRPGLLTPIATRAPAENLVRKLRESAARFWRATRLSVACRACYAELAPEFGANADGPLAVVFGDGLDLPTFRAIAGLTPGR